MKLVKVYSETCGPCKVLERNLQDANIEHKSIDFLTDEGEEFVNKYDVRSVPTLLLLDDNDNLLKKHSGLLNVEELKEFIKL